MFQGFKKPKIIRYELILKLVQDKNLKFDRVHIFLGPVQKIEMQ